jgi:tetratricopeptide (TPR) repeat protein
MLPGHLIAERFEIERRIASGGMGSIHRAHDRLTGDLVALKTLHDQSEAEPVRFIREAEALSALRHPGIVRYVAHGQTPAGELWLAMEWLEGETLSARLGRDVLTVGETVELAAAVAAALAAVHAGGFVHRDLKPSNIFLPGGDLRAAKLLDFGIARPRRPVREVTLPGTVLGTIGYLAPEQARGAREVDARADVFALGCVIFRCLVGAGPFMGEDELSILLKILVEEPQRLRELRTDVPSSLDDLVARMLAKAPGSRPADGAAVAAALAAINVESSTGPTTRRSRARVAQAELTSRERRVMSLVLARHVAAGRGETSPSALAVDRGALLRATVERHRGQLEILADRSSLVVFAGAGEATDLAVQAARCALSIRALFPGAPVTVVSGRSELSSSRLVGALIDRGVQLLQAASAGKAITMGGLPPPQTPPIPVDDATAGLLGPRFEVDAGGLLRKEREALEVTRTLLGKPTTCVGRERELASLDAALSRCLGEVAATVVLVTAPAGMGKSRLASEFLQKVREREGAPEIWIGRGDPMSAGSAFGLLGQAIRRAVGLVDGAPLDERRQKLRERVGQRERRPAEAARVAEFLGELVGTPFPDHDGDVQLRAARRDPMLLGDQMRRAWVDFLRGECNARPVLLVLEDLHWGDLPTVKLVDAALRQLESRPFMVLALGRPELHQMFPRIWSGRGVEEVHLARLPRRAGERLVRDVLGEQLDDAAMNGLLERADGNAFYLEELIRASATGEGAALPETVLAMVQARLEALDAEARRVLRAASVFGQTFTEGGVTALLGGSPAGEWLWTLAEQEVIAQSEEARCLGESTYRFRHALVREAAYGMLTEADRALGHGLAGAWLEQAGETDAMALAEHYERGEEPARAAGWYRRAAEQAFEGNDLEAACARAERGLECAEGAVLEASIDLVALRGELSLIHAEASRWLGRNPEAEKSGVEAMRLLPRGGARWCEAAAEVVYVCGKLGHVERLLESTEALLGLDLRSGDREVEASYAIALARAANTLQLSAGRQALAEMMLGRAEEMARRVDGDPEALGQVEWSRSLRVLVEGDLSTFLALVEASRRHLELAGDLRSACIQALNEGHGFLQLGAYEEAEQVLREAMGRADLMGLGSVRGYAKLNLSLALLRQRKLDEALATADEVLSLFQAQADRPLEATARTYRAMILALGGDHEGAASEALAVIGEPGTTPASRAGAQAILVEARLAEGRVAEALAAAEAAQSILTSLDGIEEGEALIRVVYAEALMATGAVRDAEAAIADARDRLLARAAKVVDPALRASFLERVPENARTLSRAREWLGEGARNSARPAEPGP